MNTFPISWSRLKSLQSNSKLTVLYVDVSNGYQVFLYDVVRGAVYTCEIAKDGGSDVSEFEATYKPDATAYPSVQDGLAQEFFNNKAACTTLGLPVVAHTKIDDTRATVITHDWTDKTSWYQGSVYVSDEVATDDGEHTVYSLGHSSVIDTYHGTLTDEDYLKDSEGRSYRVAAKVNDAAKTEQDPHTGTGGDFTVDYDTGKITFLEALDPSDVVKVTYHYSSSSVFTVKPASGKTLVIGLVEIQFSMDISPTDSVVFQPYGYAGSFAPQLGYPPTTMIPLGNPTVYKGIRDFLNGSVRSYPVYKAMGSGWRGMSQDVVIMDWDYVSNTVLDSSKGMEIRVFLQHDLPWGGEYATATFYCTTK